ncbi:MAG: hypothetical protein IJN11_09255 [Oscillospiraceae bacterium]|nr:hypothetical protein [Oscillospiraceae bacterium]
MKRWQKAEEGAFSIDALLGITFFMISILALMFMALIIRVQANVQYALGQTAKEISGYYYLLDKFGLAAITTGADERATEEVDETIGYILEFSQKGSEMKGNLDVNLFDGISEEELKNLGENEKDAAELYKTSQKITANMKDLSSDPVSQIANILSVFAKTMANKALSYYVAPAVCKSIMPRYMAGDLESTNEYLESVGVVGGLSGMDFSQSQLLTDKRSIKLVVIYKLDPAPLTFGIVRMEDGLIFRQCASTAAWVNPDDKNLYSLKTVGERNAPKPEKTEGSEENEENTEGQGE